MRFPWSFAIIELKAASATVKLSSGSKLLPEEEEEEEDAPAVVVEWEGTVAPSGPSINGGVRLVGLGPTAAGASCCNNIVSAASSSSIDVMGIRGVC